MKIKTVINKVVLASFILIISLISTNVIKATATDNQKKIIGVWQLKSNTSDKNSKKTNSDFFVLPISSAPESLILAADDEINEITINEGFKTFVNTQTLPTDGTIITKNVDLIGKISSKAYWVNNKLVVEITTAKGDQMIETFELSANQKQLIVTLQKSGEKIAKVSKTRRIYNRVAEPIEDKTAQIGLASYPF
ncbi:MAG TPA: hypothetical protein PKY82_20225 [Pyrinomonadaceae bacterium]|nr:hypothetical protein [Pyrinomonadaceae bacterium]